MTTCCAAVDGEVLEGVAEGVWVMKLEQVVGAGSENCGDYHSANAGDQRSVPCVDEIQPAYARAVTGPCAARPGKQVPG